MIKIKIMLKRFWNWLLSKTTVDEKIVERVERVKEEVADVKKAIEVVVEQAADIADAAKGKPRRGRKPAAKKNVPAQTAPAPKRTATRGRKSDK
jgi:hypothetical protein